MRSTWRGLLCVFLVAGIAAGCVHSAKVVPGSTARETAHPTPLDQYVAKADPNFTYTLVRTDKQDDFTTYVLDMTSQQWRSAAEVDRPLWKHWVVIVVPKKVKYHTAMMLIEGGSNRDDAEPPKGADGIIRKVALETQSVVAEVKMIPNEPLKFAGEDRKRTEDAIIAYTWDKFMKTGDAEWLLRLPMTKAVVRAMDTVQEFCATKEGGKLSIDSFVAAGASKRGWTTWTTTAVDKRVIACVPIVIDLLNLVPSFKHHWSVYGFWAPAIDDYTEMHVMDWLDTKEFEAMMKVVEPYSYRERLTMPKLIMNGGDDQFFLPDSSRFYINDLKGPTYLRYVPNAGHGLNVSAVGSVTSFYNAILTKTPIPQYTWTFPDDNTIRVQTSSKPSAVKLWQATNPDARDFRLEQFGQNWKSSDLSDQGGGVFAGKVATPEKGWTAYMIELTFPGVSKSPFTFTSPIRIVPDTTPFQWEPPKESPKGFLSK